MARQPSPLRRRVAIVPLSRSFGGQPSRLPFARAFRRPAFTRSTTSDRSNSATAPRTVNTILPVGVLAHDEMFEILKACDALYATTPVEGKLNAYRLKTLVLLMHYTGMRVSDAVTLTADRLTGKRLFLYTQKTSVPVYTVLPDFLVEVLNATPKMTSTHYFWTGVGKRRTVVTHWQRRLKSLFESAKVSKAGSNAVSHRFPILSPWNYCSPVYRSSAFQFSWGIKACASRKSTIIHGCAYDRSSSRPILRGLGPWIHFLLLRKRPVQIRYRLEMDGPTN